MLTIRQAEINDLPGITEIYNAAVLKLVATFDTEPKTLEEQKAWFIHHNATYPIMVAEDNGLVVGWASISRWSEKLAYAGTGEVSLYVREGFRGRGIGRKIFTSILDKGKSGGLHTVISRIVQDNDVSIHLHESLGFKHVGIMREVGQKFGKLLDVHIMQKIYDA